MLHYGELCLLFNKYIGTDFNWWELCVCVSFSYWLLNPKWTEWVCSEGISCYALLFARSFVHCVRSLRKYAATWRIFCYCQLTNVRFLRTLFKRSLWISSLENKMHSRNQVAGRQEKNESDLHDTSISVMHFAVSTLTSNDLGDK